MIYELPTSLTVQGVDYPIRTDYRVILDACCAMNDPDLSSGEKALVVIGLIFPDWESFSHDAWEEALQEALWFINCGDDTSQRRPAPKLVDWEKDFQYIVAPINRVAGCEIRAIPYNRAENTGGLHWWSFVSYYYEIGGDCVFAQIVRIRSLLDKGKHLDKTDREWYRQNRHLVDIKNKTTAAEDAIINKWIGKS